MNNFQFSVFLEDVPRKGEHVIDMNGGVRKVLGVGYVADSHYTTSEHPTRPTVKVMVSDPVK